MLPKETYLFALVAFFAVCTISSAVTNNTFSTDDTIASQAEHSIYLVKRDEPKQAIHQAKVKPTFAIAPAKDAKYSSAY